MVSSVVCLGAIDKEGFVTWGGGERGQIGGGGEEKEGTIKSGRGV